MTDKNVYPTIFIKRMGKKGKPEGQGGKLRFLRFGRPPKVDPPLAENNKGVIRIYDL